MTPRSSSQEPSPSSSTLVVSEHFKHAQNFTIGDHANLSTIHGDQHIHYTIQEQKRLRIVGTDEEEAEYEQFRQVLRSDVIALSDVHCGAIGRRYDEEQQKWVEWGERMVVAGEVRIGGVASKCMAVSYSGEGAEEGWKKDFRRLGGVRRPENAQLVAINLSRIPMLVLTGDLVPAAHLWDQVGRIERLCLAGLVMQMGCWEEELWIDTSRGVFCRGPKGPHWRADWLDYKLDNLPLDAEIIKEDVLFRYLASRKLDREVVNWLSEESEVDDSQVKVDQPTVISTLDDTILAAGSGVWNEVVLFPTCLGWRTELPNGTTRFTLEHNRHGLELKLDRWEAKEDWIAQALSVFHAHGISLEGDMSAYKLIFPWSLEGTVSDSEAKRRRRRKCSPIYLFVLPLSTSTFWSFDQDGQTAIPTDLCRYLGLPPSLSLTCWQYSGWPTSTYKALRDYQVARNFDPTTTDFARYHGYRIYEVVKTPLSSHFEEIDDSATTEDSPTPETLTCSPSGACTPEDGRQALVIEDMSLRLLFGDTPLEVCRNFTLVATPTAHQGSSADSRRRTSGRLLQKGSPSKSLSPSSVFQAARRPVSGLKTFSKPMALTPTKPMTVPKPLEVATRTVAPPSRKTPFSSAKDGTKAVSPVNRGTTPRNPPRSGGSTLRDKEGSTRGTVNAASRIIPSKPMRKPVSVETRSSPNVSGSTLLSTSRIKTTSPRSSDIPPSRPNPTIGTTERAATKIGAPSAPPQTSPGIASTTAAAKKPVSHPTTPRSNGVTTASRRPPPTPRTSLLRAPTSGNAVASSSGVTTQVGTIQQRRPQERIGTTALKGSSDLHTVSRSPVVATSRVTRTLATRPSVQRDRDVE